MPFEHLKFARHWTLSTETNYRLGRCHALVDYISTTPVSAEVRRELKRVAIIKGTQATAAIEGNTLSEEEVGRVADGDSLPPSKAYQAQEVANILRAMNEVLRSKPALITPQLLLHYHECIGRDLPPPFGATPGVFAQSHRTVGAYRCPPPGRGARQVEGLVKRLCKWLQAEFNFAGGGQSFRDGIIQAIVTHVYIEWIHPFDDGNGRTGRLVEFYLLLRAGVPDTCAHILSNHYNQTRPEYYAHLQNCQRGGDLTPFIEYAVAGFLDGLTEVWKVLADEWLARVWRGYVDDQLASFKWNRPTAERRRLLLHDMAIDAGYAPAAVAAVSPQVAAVYAGLGPSAVKRDIAALLEVGLLIQDADSGEVSAHIGPLRGEYPNQL